MFKLGELVKLISDVEIIYEVINVKNSGLLYDLKRCFDILVLKNIPRDLLIPVQ